MRRFSSALLVACLAFGVCTVQTTPVQAGESTMDTAWADLLDFLGLRNKSSRSSGGLTSLDNSGSSASDPTNVGLFNPGGTSQNTGAGSPASTAGTTGSTAGTSGAGAGGGSTGTAIGALQNAQPVPEPGTWALLALGASGLSAFAVRRRRVGDAKS